MIYKETESVAISARPTVAISAPPSITRETLANFVLGSPTKRGKIIDVCITGFQMP
jgi:hypothetical protein